MFMRVVNAKELGLFRREGLPQATLTSAGAIVDDVRLRGDKALLEYTGKFDRVRISPDRLRLDQKALRGAYESTPAKLRTALERSADRIRRFQQLQLPEPVSVEISPGVTIGVAFYPLGSVGIYVPGGRAAYPSTVLMTGVPVKMAGVKRVAMFTPPSSGGIVPAAVLAAAFLAEVDEVFTVGGAQAVAAMAYGTETIGRVEKIVGPGNTYVQAAKMIVSRDVSVDMPAGPSEVLIYAESPGREEWIATDMLAQAEHDPEARVMLVTPDSGLVTRVVEALGRAIQAAPRREILEKSMAEALVVMVKDREEGIEVINEVAPEHLQLMGDCPRNMLMGVLNAGATFLGDFSAVALGDYSVGTNHVLPTMGWARRASPLSVRDFLRAREFIRCTREGVAAVGRDAIAIGEVEGLLNHVRSIQLRMEEAVGKGGTGNEL